MIIVRGFGNQEDLVTEYVPVPVCSPEITAHEWGKKSMKADLYSIIPTPRVVIVSECE